MKGFWKDFSWMEFCILLVLLTGLIFFTAPKYKKFQCRAKWSEVQFSLREIYAAEILYFSEYETYSTVNELLGTGRVKLGGDHYRYFTQSISEKGFTIGAEAIFDDEFAGDAWTINENNELEHIVDTCMS